MRHRLRAVLHPEWYHGARAAPPFFEGWYYRLIDAGERQRYAVIPGISLGTDGDDRHAFVQVLNDSTGQATYHRFATEEFRSAEGRFDVRIGPNRFTPERISLRIESPQRSVSGEVHFSGLTPWLVTLTSPGTMGWYTWVPRMECYHGVLSLDHQIHGTLTIDGSPVAFTGGRGTIEKD